MVSFRQLRDAKPEELDSAWRSWRGPHGRLRVPHLPSGTPAALQELVLIGVLRLFKELHELAPHGHLTAVGHSYESTVIGEAARQPGDRLRGDDIMVAGSPGMHVMHAGDLGIGAGHVYAQEARGDQVPAFGRYGGHLHVQRSEYQSGRAGTGGRGNRY
ncbi:alpha/beta hydrolase [Actinomadura opuntiae]|uniref:alpha/beta hydrolase n=1 Tax=Actinomadura sp. OS1-43 TaxID=604315 RepID=UPI00255B2DA0|nr:alpha/beta hydrolase [Actinomadura sp. OS1-43]MDL4814769.1 alpha/beta hydrolase [Actinomadura sp. OS1-43]